MCANMPSKAQTHHGRPVPSLLEESTDSPDGVRVQKRFTAHGHNRRLRRNPAEHRGGSPAVPGAYGCAVSPVSMRITLWDLTLSLQGVVDLIHIEGVKSRYVTVFGLECVGE